MNRILSMFFSVLALYSLSAPERTYAAFGLTTSSSAYTVDTGAGLVFSVRRNRVSNSQSAGDISSLVWNGVEFQDWAKGSHIASGLGTPSVTASTIGSDLILITVSTPGVITHYYVVRKNDPTIYMATNMDSGWSFGETRWITRLNDYFTHRPPGSDLAETDHTVESSDVFGTPNGETRSKYYGNSRAKELPLRGESGPGVGVFMAFGSRETSDGGPFFRDIQNQRAEVYNYMNSGHNQTEYPLRIGPHGYYALIFTDGSSPSAPDFSFMDDLGLPGFVPASGRGSVAGGAITGRDTRYTYTVALKNSEAQYWADAKPSDGSFLIYGVKPGSYTLEIFKNELAVYSNSVTVTVSNQTSFGSIGIMDDPSRTVPVWRIGDWDGTPREFLNGDKVTIMHPSDIRMASWNPGAYVVGSSTPSIDMPAYSWKDVNGSREVQFNLTAGQIQNSTIRIGITAAYAGARPQVNVNSWWSAIPFISSQPDSRSMTIGTYRGNNTFYTYNVPASALVVGVNTFHFNVTSGSGGTGFLSPGYSLDCIDLVQGSSTVSPPAAPASLSATPNGADVLLSWPSVSGASGYLIQRTTESGGPYMTIAEVATTNSTHANAGGGMGYYIVKAVNAAGAGMASPEAAATVAGGVDPWVSLVFDETNGTTAVDSSGNGWNGTLTNGAAFVAGHDGNTVNFDGNGQFVSLPSGVVSSLNDFTVATWVKVNSATNWARICDFGSGPMNSMTLISQTDSGHPGFSIRTFSDEAQTVESSVALPVGAWTHIAVSKEGDTCTIYINGVPVGVNPSFTLRPWQLGVTTQNYLGRMVSHADPALAIDPDFNGQLDDFRIYARGLSGTEIYALWGGSTNQSPAFSSKPVVLAAIDQGVDYGTLSLSLTNSVADPDGGTPTFTKISGPDWLAVASNGDLSGIPGNADVGLNSFIVRASDASGASDTAEMRVTVNNANDAPYWISISLTRQTINAGLPYFGTSLGKDVSDIDIPYGDTVTISKISGPDWLNVAADGTLSGTASPSDEGENNFTVRVTDSHGLSNDASLSIYVFVSDFVTHLKFDEYSGTTAYDDGGSFCNGTLVNGVAWDIGKLKYCVNLNGADQYITLPDGLVSGLNDFTVCAWVKIPSFSDWTRVFDFGTGTDNYMFLTTQYSGSTRLLRYGIRTPSVNEQVINSTTALPINTWAHVAVAQSGSTARLYINGAQVGSSTISLKPSSLGITTQNCLGKSQWPDPDLNGSIDDFRIYTRALSAAEVDELAHPPAEAPDSVTATPENGGAIIEWVPGNAADSYSIKRSTTSGGSYTTVISNLTETTFTDTGLTNGTVYYYVVTSSNGQGESGPSTEVAVIPSSVRAYYRFEEGISGTAVPTAGDPVIDSANGDDDATAYSSDVAPTYVNVVPVATIPQTEQTNALSLHFDGIDDEIYVSEVGPLRTAALGDFTVEAYVFFSGSTTSGTQTIVGRDDNGEDPNPESLFYLSRVGFYPHVGVCTVGGDLLALSSSYPTIYNRWYHVAVVGDTSTGLLTLYVDGISRGSVPGYDGMFDPASDPAWTIGRGQYNGNPVDFLNGYIDEVRISSKALSPSQFLNAVNPDSDHDGLDDAWEITYFGDLRYSGIDDPDGDGYDNATEQANGTPPNISSIPPDIDIAITNGMLNLGWPSNNIGWRLLYNTNLMTNAWIEIPGFDTTNGYSTSVTGLPHKVFYRMVYP